MKNKKLILNTFILIILFLILSLNKNNYYQLVTILMFIPIINTVASNYFKNSDEPLRFFTESLIWVSLVFDILITCLLLGRTDNYKEFILNIHIISSIISTITMIIINTITTIRRPLLSVDYPYLKLDILENKTCGLTEKQLIKFKYCKKSRGIFSVYRKTVKLYNSQKINQTDMMKVMSEIEINLLKTYGYLYGSQNKNFEDIDLTESNKTLSKWIDDI